MSYAGSHKPACTAGIVLLATCSWLLGGVGVRADARAPVVRVYDTANGDRLARATSIRTAAAIVSDAGITVAWHDCTRPVGQPDCQNPGHGDLIIRIMPTAPHRAGAAANSLLLRAAPGEEQAQLGQLATVFQQPVQRIANRARIAPAELLGRTIAHEVGHLLLRTRSHSSTGLMREIWTLEELAANRRDDWHFSPGDRLRLQEQLATSVAPRESNEGEQAGSIQLPALESGWFSRDGRRAARRDAGSTATSATW